MTASDPSSTTSSAEREVVAVRKEERADQWEPHEHVTAIKLKDGTVVQAADAIREIADPAAHVHYVMRPPEGAPAYRAHQETGLLLEFQARPCPTCGEEVLFA